MAFNRQDLSDMNKLWNDAAAGAGDDAGPGEVPEGKYQAKVKSAELMKSAGSGRPQCKWVFKIVGGVESAIGKMLSTNDGLESAMNMGYFKKKLRRLQLDVPTEFEEIPELLAKAIGAVVDIQVKYKDDFLNVYINKLISAAAESEEEEEEPAAKPAKAKPAAKVVDEDEEEDEAPAPAKKSTVKDADEDDEDEEPAPVAKKAAKAAVKDDDDDDEAETKEAEETEEAEEAEEAAPARNFPTMAEIDKLPEKGLRKLLKQFKLEPAPEKKVSLLAAVSKVLVSIMEDDDYDAPAGDMKVACKWLSIKPEDENSVKKMTKQLIKALGG